MIGSTGDAYIPSIIDRSDGVYRSNIIFRYGVYIASKVCGKYTLMQPELQAGARLYGKVARRLYVEKG
jgi:hypothetical protein